jgi:probable HAF family extracellular repeat protein
MSTARRRMTVLVMMLVLGLLAPATSEAAGAQTAPGAGGGRRITATKVVGPNGESLSGLSLNEEGQVRADVQWTVPDPQGRIVLWQRGRARFVEPAGVDAYSSDLSDTGQVVGSADGIDAFAWQGGTWRLLAPGVPSRAEANNDVGQVAGVRFPDPESPGQVVVWQPDGTVVPAPVATANPVVVDINDRGQVLFVDHASGPEPVPLVWQVGGGVTELGSLGGGFTVPSDINDRGQVVGSSGAADGLAHAFLWEDGRMTDLGGPFGGPPGYAGARAVAVNEHGDVVGTSTDDGPDGTVVTRGLLWKDGRTIDLGNLGGTGTAPAAINDNGQIVGTSTIASAVSESHPFLWENGRMTDLSAFRGDLDFEPAFGSAGDINNRGQILGGLGGTTSSGQPIAHTILWSTRRAGP